MLVAIYFDCDSMNAENGAVQDLNEQKHMKKKNDDCLGLFLSLSLNLAVINNKNLLLLQSAL